MMDEEEKKKAAPEAADNTAEEPDEDTVAAEAKEVPSEASSEEPAKKGFGGKKKSADSKELKKLKEELMKARDELEEAKSRYMRLAAEYDNYKKRTAREMDSRYADAKLDVLKELLPILDNFERGLEVACSDSAYKEGVELIFKQFTDLLAQQGVTEIEAIGQTFDPNFHNAVMHIEDESLGENTIAEVFMKGYKQGDKVLRHSMVKVAN